MLARVHIKHKLPQRALHSRHTTFKYREARTAEFGRCFEIDACQSRAKIDVIFRREIEHPWCAEAAHFDVINFGFAIWHFGAGDIGNCA